MKFSRFDFTVMQGMCPLHDKQHFPFFTLTTVTDSVRWNVGVVQSRDSAGTPRGG